MASGTDFVFVHGGGQAGWVWDETIGALSLQTHGAFGRALALDGPGCGAKQDRDTANMSYEQVIDDLIGDIERSGFRDIVLVGHSQAGTILPALLRRRPDLFRRAVYVSCSAPLPGQSILEMMGRGRHGANADEVGFPVAFDEDVTAEDRYRLMFCNDMSDADADAFVACLGQDNWPMSTMVFNGFRYDDLGVVPATFVMCVRDGILPLAWQEKFADRLGASRRIVIDAGHQAMNTRPHALAEILLNEAVG
jgi:pimeloyl-ACP methyl ester carboxylesterase